MTPIDFLRTIYLGDRMCKAFHIDGHKGEVKIEVDLISRVRGQAWDFYSEEDIQDGFVVLEGVTSIAFEPAGPLPNDWIEFESAHPLEKDGTYRISLSVGAASADSASVVEVKVEIVAKSLCLENSKGERIRS